MLIVKGKGGPYKKIKVMKTVNQRVCMSREIKSRCVCVWKRIDAEIVLSALCVRTIVDRRLHVADPLWCSGNGSLHTTLGWNLGSGPIRDGLVVSAVAALSRGLCLWCGVYALVPGASAVDAGPCAFSAIALLKSTIVVVGRLVPSASHDVVNVRAPLLGVLSNASSDAEGVVVHEILPFVNLLELTSECSSKEETSHGVTSTSGTVGVEFTTLVLALDVEVGQFTMSSDLDKGGRLEEVGAVNGSIGNQTSAVSRLHAPSNLTGLRVTNGLALCVWCPETKVLDAVDKDVLALG